MSSGDSISLDTSVTQEAFGAMVGISQPAVSDLVTRGILHKGDSVRTWLLSYCDHMRGVAAGRDPDGEARRAGIETPRDRVFRLQGDDLEMELAKKAGRLIDVDQVEPKWQAAVIAAREGLLRERRRLAKLLVGVTDLRQCEDILGQAHEAYLRRLSTWRQAGDDIEPKDIEP